MNDIVQVLSNHTDRKDPPNPLSLWERVRVREFL